MDGSICRKNLKKMMEVLVVKFPMSDNWALPGVSGCKIDHLRQDLKN